MKKLIFIFLCLILSFNVFAKKTKQGSVSIQKSYKRKKTENFFKKNFKSFSWFVFGSYGTEEYKASSLKNISSGGSGLPKSFSTDVYGTIGGGITGTRGYRWRYLASFSISHESFEENETNSVIGNKRELFEFVLLASYKAKNRIFIEFGPSLCEKMYLKNNSDSSYVFKKATISEIETTINYEFIKSKSLFAQFRLGQFYQFSTQVEEFSVRKGMGLKTGLDFGSRSRGGEWKVFTRIKRISHTTSVNEARKLEMKAGLEFGRVIF